MTALARSRWRLARSLAASVFLVTAPLASHSAAGQADPSEYDLKAAFLYQFLSYVNWPETRTIAGGPVQIGVVGAPELANNLSGLAAGLPGNARPIEVHMLTPDADPAELHVLFVAGDVEASGLLRIAAQNSVLTITEAIPRPSHSVINFEIVDSKVRFDVALTLARDHGLEISGRLLQVAQRVLE